jgi:GTP cyclohydrolase I
MEATGMREGTAHAIVAIGSNIERERNLPEAIRMLRRTAHITVERVSRFYESPSIGGPEDAPDFFNAAAYVCTELPPVELREALRAIEAELGRERSDDPNAPRRIDLDIAYYGDVELDIDGWVLPDPMVGTAAHIAIPTAEIAPDWVHPADGRTTLEIAEQIRAGEVRPVMAIQLSTPYSPRAPEDFDDTADVYAPKFESLVREQLVEIGEDPDREGLVRTPLRVAKAMDFLTSGYSTSLDEVVNNAVFDAEGAEEMVLVRDVEFYSMCEHHMLPFFGKAAVAYLPKGRIIGLSKVARIVDVFARRLQVQERLTNQVADAMTDILDPHGVAVVMEGRHLCMMMRGVQKQESAMITSAMRGTFKDDPRTRNEFLDLAR